ncbi:hypothetical protein SUGI_0489450 [Cryptomeria japonica]|nr:hypothetical protein SUGI_0489450 [Cryptomeria japonica]
MIILKELPGTCGRAVPGEAARTCARCRQLHEQSVARSCLSRRHSAASSQSSYSVHRTPLPRRRQKMTNRPTEHAAAKSRQPGNITHSRPCNGLRGRRFVWNSVLAAGRAALRRDFACAVVGTFVYVAGGFGDGDESLSRAARFDTVIMVWEALPDMTAERDNSAGFVMDGKFNVIDGFKACPAAVDDVEVYSAEVYDPETATWTLVEGMWAESLQWRAGPDDRGQWEYLGCFGGQCGDMKLVGGEDDLYGVCGCVCSSQGKLSVFVFTHGDERFDWRKIELCDVALKGCDGVTFGCCCGSV